jgi:hypothetical protein
LKLNRDGFWAIVRANPARVLREPSTTPKAPENRLYLMNSSGNNRPLARAFGSIDIAPYRERNCAAYNRLMDLFLIVESQHGQVA